jgi:DNA-binding NtrC family response regulator
MNFSTPILICDENEEFRILLREMLTKNGYFHIVEASTEVEALGHLGSRTGLLVLVNGALASNSLLEKVRTQRDFVVFADPSETLGQTLAMRLGVAHVISYPVHSRKLLEKFNSLL